MQATKKERIARVLATLLVFVGGVVFPYTEALAQGPTPANTQRVVPTGAPSFGLQPGRTGRQRIVWSADSGSRRSSVRPVVIGILIGGVLGGITGHAMDEKGYSCPTSPGLSCRNPGLSGNTLGGVLAGAVLGGVVGLLITHLR